MSTDAILEQLQAFGIPVEASEFVEQLDVAETLDDILPHYTDDVPSLGADADFPWLAFFTLAPRLRPDKPLVEHVRFWMDDGYSFEVLDEAKVSDTWWPVWTYFLNSAKQKGIRSIEALDEWYVDDLDQFISNWMVEFDETLHNAGIHQPEYAKKRLEFVQSAQAQFTESGPSHLFDWARVEAECLFQLGDAAAGDAAYAHLVERFPDEGFGYIGWADEHSPTFAVDPANVDPERALQIYELGLAHGTADDDEIRSRIAMLREDVPDVGEARA